MNQPNNGQALSTTQPARPRYTGELLLRTRPKVYRQIVRLLSEGVSANQICKLCHVTRETVRAVERREAGVKNGARPAAPVIQKIRHQAKIKEQVRQWADIIGLRAAARKFGVNEHTATVWAHREQWPTPECWKLSRAEREALKSAAATSRAIQDDILKEQSDKTMLYMSSAALKASYEAAGMSGEQLLDKNAAIALEAHNRVADRTHGWTAMRQQNQVAVAVQVQMPTPEERAERTERHRKLDEIARRLKELSVNNPSTLVLPT